MSEHDNLYLLLKLFSLVNCNNILTNFGCKQFLMGTIVQHEFERYKIQIGSNVFDKCF